MNGDEYESTPEKEHLYDSLGIALLITFPFVFIWGAILWDQYSSLPLVASVATTYALVFCIVHLWRRR